MSIITHYIVFHREHVLHTTGGTSQHAALSFRAGYTVVLFANLHIYKPQLYAQYEIQLPYTVYCYR